MPRRFCGKSGFVTTLFEPLVLTSLAFPLVIGKVGTASTFIVNCSEYYNYG
jgi:hypothetical protein